jgi:hypothetical protein
MLVDYAATPRSRLYAPVKPFSPIKPGTPEKRGPLADLPY